MYADVYSINTDVETITYNSQYITINIYEINA